MTFYNGPEARRREFAMYLSEQQEEIGKRLQLLEDFERRWDWEKTLIKIGADILPIKPMPYEQSEEKTGEHQVLNNVATTNFINRNNLAAGQEDYSHLILPDPDEPQPQIHKPLTIISLGNELHHPSPEEMDSVRDQLVDMGIQDFLVVPYQVAIHQASVPMVAEERKEDTFPSQPPPIDILNLCKDIEKQLDKHLEYYYDEPLPPTREEKSIISVLHTVREAIEIMDRPISEPSESPPPAPANWKEIIKNLGSPDCPHTKRAVAEKTRPPVKIKYGEGGRRPKVSANDITESYQRNWSEHKDIIDACYAEEAICEAVEA